MNAPDPASHRQGAAVLALGAWLKNAACRLDATGPHWSPVHGDLRDPRACEALERSASALAAASPTGLRAIAHDLHPDFYSTRLALRLAEALQVPAIGVQHHHAHIAAVMAEHGLDEPVIGLALDGVGLGADGTAWGGELLLVSPSAWRRLGHLSPLALPGGDIAATQPWRMLASALHALGRGAEIEARLGSVVGSAPARAIAQMLEAGLRCPPTSSAGRWFDAAAAALGLHAQRQDEAEAAMALERQAALHPRLDDLPALPSLAGLASPPCADAGMLDLRPLLATLIDWKPAPDAVPAAAAWFHLALGHLLADWAAEAAATAGTRVVCLGGGCFMNRILDTHVTRRLQRHGLSIRRPVSASCGDAGIALGQAWVARHRADPATDCTFEHANESASCA